jgi:hypothetical protein
MGNKFGMILINPKEIDLSTKNIMAIMMQAAVARL